MSCCDSGVSFCCVLFSIFVFCVGVVDVSYADELGGDFIGLVECSEGVLTKLGCCCGDNLAGNRWEAQDASAVAGLVGYWSWMGAGAAARSSPITIAMRLDL